LVHGAEVQGLSWQERVSMSSNRGNRGVRVIPFLGVWAVLAGVIPMLWGQWQPGAKFDLGDRVCIRERLQGVVVDRRLTGYHNEFALDQWEYKVRISRTSPREFWVLEGNLRRDQKYARAWGAADMETVAALLAPANPSGT